jgi:hypothetical protein
MCLRVAEAMAVAWSRQVIECNEDGVCAITEEGVERDGGTA